MRSPPSTKRAGAISSQQRDELTTVRIDLAKTEDAIERYLLAFEAGTRPETQLRPRLRTLGAKADELRARETELAQLIDNAELMRVPAGMPSRRSTFAVHRRITS